MRLLWVLALGQCSDRSTLSGNEICGSSRWGRDKLQCAEDSCKAVRLAGEGGACQRVQEKVNMAAGSPDDRADIASAICCACRAGPHLCLPIDSARACEQSGGFAVRTVGGRCSAGGRLLSRSITSSAASTAMRSPSNRCTSSPLPCRRKYTSRSASPSKLAHLHRPHPAQSPNQA